MYLFLVPARRGGRETAGNRQTKRQIPGLPQQALPAHQSDTTNE